jgi:nitrite transporter NirC
MLPAQILESNLMIDRPYVEKAVDTGVRKLALLESDPKRYIVRSILAGMYLSIVLFVFWCLNNNLHDSPFGKVIASAFFGVGLTIIVFTNTELFTSNNMYMAVSSTEGQTSWSHTVLLWVICYLGNLLGALIVAGLLYAAGSLQELPLNHALYMGAEHKVHQAALVIFTKGILANWVVCLAVRLAIRCKDDIAKIAVLIPVVFIFLYLGFEHSIANMGTFSMSLLGNGTITFGEALYNLTFSTLGNVVGGVFFVGLPFAYLNPSDEHVHAHSTKNHS